MSLAMTFLVAVKALRRNAMRTALTALGMIIGVAAVIVMMALGNGARDSIETQIRSAGSNMVTVSAGAGRFGPVRGGQGGTTTLTEADAEAIRSSVSGIQYLSPGVNTRAQVVAAAGNWNTTIQGSGAEFQDIRSWPAQFGSFFTEQDVSRSAKVAILGSVVRDQLFGPGADPVGEAIRIRNQPFRVIGVLTSKGAGSFGQDQDDTVIVPYTTLMRKLLGQDYLREISISAQAGVELETVTTSIETLLRERHRINPGDEDDFMVRTLDEIAGVLTQTTTTMTYLLASIAAVSLLVGGIGIMNIMLVSVTERTREIGLRLSVGARDVDVLLQFLTEAMVLSLTGGALGVALGFGAASALSSVMQWTTLVTTDAVLLSFGCAAFIGIFFGFYPARKAAALDPIEALRFE
ncbi:MAG: FtsX-like permease family protein [Acidobacteria bacterium]|nr:FtsX-like permease family protein [Acidobacteriota bacterium]